VRIHHVQLAIPRGGEDTGRRFYAEGLGLTEVDKPADLVGRGGCWFRGFDADGAVTVEVHLGVEDPFAPARKAHPAFLVGDPAELGRLGERLAALGYDVDAAERHSFPGHERLHVRDGHRNRVELLAVAYPNP
jgi:catechol 2,3-dioxygenase-like lactoylglutathione lyase family enzyme